MTTEGKALDVLLALAAREATGELICASESGEVHVYLQRGRLAWATDSEHPFAFTRHLQEMTGIDTESFRDILDSCRRERRPLGETLVSWGVTTAEDVRAALRHQIELALGVLRADVPAQTLFIDRTRQFADYASDLTFDVRELTSGDGEQEGTRGTRTVPPAPKDVSMPPASRHARRLLESVEGLLWAELFERTTVIESAPEPAQSERFPRTVIEQTLLDGADLVALRGPEGTLAGVALGSSRSLWCRLAADATVGAAMAAIAAIAAPERHAPGVDVAPFSASKSWTLGQEDAAPLRELREFLVRAPETLAALLTAVDDDAWAFGAGASAVAPQWALDVARRRGRVLAAPLFDDERTREDETSVGFAFRSMVTAERNVWCFAAELATHPRCVLWLLLGRTTSQGLGWAYLTSLSRRLLHLRDWGRHG